MTTRELWRKIMHYEEFDRMPVHHWCGWDETRRRWLTEGLPEGMSEHQFFNADPMHHGISVDLGLCPPFEEETLEETAEYKVVRQSDGVVCKQWKGRSCIPQYLDFTLKGARGWPEYKKRLMPRAERIPRDLDQQISRAEESGLPLFVGTASMIGWIRNWMGVENLGYLCHDDRDLLSEMVDTVAELACWGIDQVLPKIRVDMGWGWEDICFRGGPLVSPEVFRECAVPGYRKIASKLRRYGVDLYVVDCDGFIDPLVPLWLESGVNVMFPVEIGAWKADPDAFRKRYGRQLRVFGGIDKLEIARGPGAIDAEIARRLPLMKEGGFIPLPDHVIPPETSLQSYRYYLERIRALRF